MKGVDWKMEAPSSIMEQFCPQRFNIAFIDSHFEMHHNMYSCIYNTSILLMMNKKCELWSFEFPRSDDHKPQTLFPKQAFHLMLKRQAFIGHKGGWHHSPELHNNILIYCL